MSERAKHDPLAMARRLEKLAGRLAGVVVGPGRRRQVDFDELLALAPDAAEQLTRLTRENIELRVEIDDMNADLLQAVGFLDRTRQRANT